MGYGTYSDYRASADEARRESAKHYRDARRYARLAARERHHAEQARLNAEWWRNRRYDDGDNAEHAEGWDRNAAASDRLAALYDSNVPRERGWARESASRARLYDRLARERDGGLGE